MLEYIIFTYIDNIRGRNYKMKYILFVFLFTFAYTQPLPLTPQEKQILENHPLTCISTGLWAPFNLLEDGKFAGIGFDYWDIIRERLDIKNGCKIAESWTQVLNAIKNKTADMTIATQPTPERLEYASFSRPYVTYPIVIATKNDVGFIHNIDLLKDKTIAIGKGYAVAHILKEYYPTLKVMYVESIDEALDLVDKEKVYATIEILPVLAYKLNKDKFNNLKISGSIPHDFPISIMLRKDHAVLLPLINKAINSITKEEKNRINERWIMIHRTSKVLSKYFYALLFSALFIFTFFSIWLLLLKKEIIQKSRTEKKLKKLVNIDSLTSIFNRYMLDMTLEKEIVLVERHHNPLSVIFFDIDGFKNINDKYGHKVGDSILKELSSLVSKSIRKSDVFGRWGGDEFLLVLLETKEEDAVKFAEHLKNMIETHKFKGHMYITCSFGVTSYKEDDTPQSMITRVDALFYKDKRIKNNHKVNNET